MGTRSTRDCLEPHTFSASPSNSQLQDTPSDTLGDISLWPCYCNQCLLSPMFWKVRPWRLPCLCCAEEHVHRFCRGGDAGFSSLFEAMACDFHVSSATSCLEWETSITLLPVAETLRGTKVFIYSDPAQERWRCVCMGRLTNQVLLLRVHSPPKDVLLAELALTVSSDLFLFLSHLF